MKKSLFVLVLLMALVSMGCAAQRVPMTTETFTDSAIASGFAVLDSTSQYKDVDIQSAVLAMGSGFQVEFLIVPDDKDAEILFFSNKQRLESQKTDRSNDAFVRKANYMTYELTTQDAYAVMSQTDNTMVFATVTLEHRDTVRRFLELIGY